MPSQRHSRFSMFASVVPIAIFQLRIIYLLYSLPSSPTLLIRSVPSCGNGRNH